MDKGSCNTHMSRRVAPQLNLTARLNASKPCDSARVDTAEHQLQCVHVTHCGLSAVEYVCHWAWVSL